LVWGVLQKNYKQTLPADATENTATNTIQATYSGTLLCGDCSGMETTLVLNQNSNNQPSTYTQTSIYLGKNVEPLVESGNWSIENQETSTGPRTIYALTSLTGSKQYFLKQENTLKMLDADQNPLPANLLSTLTKSN
jgi:copper homeostasis protein (lipoprotein)